MQRFMGLDMIDRFEDSFQRLLAILSQSLTEAEQFTLQLSGEISQFTRINRARVRQTGIVQDEIGRASCRERV